MNPIDTAQLKKIVKNLDEPVKKMIDSLPEEIDARALVEKFDLILQFLKKEGRKND